MKKFNYKSRKGFTLIELLVVIGILAVLAAIAIPSVAGLIDRANVSADDTNANEMTNAVERFTSEYELFCQDIASGKLNTNDLDAAQSRVYNVTGADSRDDITQLESENGLDNKQLHKDTKYPTNTETIKSVVENYTKTSSATFEPKQSDMHFWYSPDCGVVVLSEPNSINEVLNKKIISGKDAKGKILDDSTVWIDITAETENMLASYPEYTDADIDKIHIFAIGKNNRNDVIAEFNSDYTEAKIYKNTASSSGEMMDWDLTNTSDPEIEESPFYHYGQTSLKKVTVAYGITNIGNETFYGCEVLENVILPNTIKHFGKFSFAATNIKDMGRLPSSLKIIETSAFEANPQLTNAIFPNGLQKIGDTAFSGAALNQIIIPDSVTELGHGAFEHNKATYIKLGSGIKKLYYLEFAASSSAETIILTNGIEEISGGQFSNCTNLKKAYIPSSLKTIGYSEFNNCILLEELYIEDNPNIKINGFNRGGGCPLTIYCETQATADKVQTYNIENATIIVDASKF